MIGSCNARHVTGHLAVTVLVLLSLVLALVAGCTATPAAPTAAPAQPTAASAAPPPASPPTKAAATAPKVDPSKPAIVFGGLTDMTGPAALAGSLALAGWTDGIKYVNETKGGVLGHEVKLALFDTKYEVPMNTTGWNKLVQQDKALAVINIASNGLAAVRPLAERDKVVAWGPGEPTALFPPQGSYVFTLMPIYGANIKNSLKWIKDTWKGSSRPRIGGHFMDSAPGYSGYTGLVTGMKEYFGVDPDAVAWSAPAAVDLTAQVMALKQANLDYIVDLHTTGPTVAFMKAMQAAGINPKTYLSGLHNLFDGIYNSGGDGMIGMLGTSPFSNWADADVPGIKLLRELNAKNHPEVVYRDVPYMHWFLSIQMLSQAAERVIQRDGYDKLTPEKIKLELESGKAFNTLGIIPDVTFTPTNHLLPNQSKIYRWDGAQKWTAISDWVKGGDLTAEMMKPEYWQKK